MGGEQEVCGPSTEGLWASIVTRRLEHRAGAVDVRPRSDRSAPMSALQEVEAESRQKARNGKTKTYIFWNADVIELTYIEGDNDKAPSQSFSANSSSSVCKRVACGCSAFRFSVWRGEGHNAIVSGIFVMKEVTRSRPTFGKADESESRHSGHRDLNRGQCIGHSSSDPVRMHVLLLAFWAADVNADVQLDRHNGTRLRISYAMGRTASRPTVPRCSIDMNPLRDEFHIWSHK